MPPVPMPSNTTSSNWSTLVKYYQQCLQHEQMQRLQVSLEQKGYALLRNFADQLISHGAPEAVITGASDVQQVRQLIARSTASDDQKLYYAFPLVTLQRGLIPVCYTEVSIKEGPQPSSLLIRREGELLVNRRFLIESGDLADAQVAEFARRLRTGDAVDARLQELLGDGVIVPDGMLFRADPDVMTRSLLRELEWIERQARLSKPLNAYIQGALPAPALADTPGVTVVRSNPAQDKVLRKRTAVLQVVAGPPGTGKTQTIINLIASAVCDRQTVLFVSKNNTAVDNVYDAFLEQHLFPGILRLGSQEVRVRTADYFRTVLTSLAKGLPPQGDRAEFETQGEALARQIARLEEELTEVERLESLAAEMALLLRRTDEDLRESGFYRLATDLAQRITPANAGQFQPQQMVGLRRLVASTAAWQEEPDTLWARLLELLRLLEPIRRQKLQQGLTALRLPACCAICGRELTKQVEALLRLEVIYPFLLATARELSARTELDRRRQRAAIRADLDQAYAAKVEHDRRQLSRRWAEIVSVAQPQVTKLQELIPLFERMAAGTADKETRHTWWQRYRELLSVFPVICSTNLSLASIAPNELERFDLVILDEASQSDIPSFLPALFRAGRACVVGDDMQLSHISNLGGEEDERLMATLGLNPNTTLSYHRSSAFDRAAAVAGQAAFTLLDRHYRCVPAIIGFCNERFYDGRLKLERRAEPGVALRGGLPSQGFIVDDVAPGQTEYRAAGASRSARNAVEAERVISLVRQYIKAGMTDIGVVTPFRAQRELLQQTRTAAVQSEPDPTVQSALQQVEIGTIHAFQGGQHRLMLFSTVVAPGARAGTIRWFEENKNLLNVAISRAKDLLIVVCHRATLERSGGIIAAMVSYADGLARSSGRLPPLPPGLQPQRLGLLPSEAEILRAWLTPPGAVAEVLNGGEQALYRELQALIAGRRALVAPKMRVLDAIDPAKLPDLTQLERDYAFRAHFDTVVVSQDSFRPVAAVELDGRTHDHDPLTQARDRLKNSLCEKVGLPLVRVRWGDWGALTAVDRVLRS